MEEKSNKKKIIIISIISIILVVIGAVFVTKVLFSGSSENKGKEKDKEEEVVKEKITPLMYEITKEGSDNIIYLFGTMHAVNLNEFDFPKYVMDAYNESDIVAPEFDLVAVLQDQKLMQEYAMSMYYNDGTTIKDHLSSEVYNNLIAFMKDKKMYNQMYEYIKLNELESLITNQLLIDSKITSDGVDEYFLNLAKKDKKEIIDVESFEFQTNLLSSFSDRLYEIEIENVINNYEKNIEMLKKLYKIWKNGDSEELLVLLTMDLTDEELAKLSEEDKQLIENYNIELVDKRNVGMKNKLEEFFENNQKVFFMVGTAHLVGEKGIANLLVQDGYSVKQVNK